MSETQIVKAQPVEVVDAEVWEVVEATSTGRKTLKIPVPTGDQLTMLQEAYLIKGSMPGMAAKSMSECMFLVQKARSMGLSAIKGDVSLIEGRVATSDAAKGRAVVCNPDLVDFSVSEPTPFEHPLVCSCGHPKILHGTKKTDKETFTNACNFRAELSRGTKLCSCTECKPKQDVYVEVKGRMKSWGGAPVAVRTYLSEWYNPKNDAWVEYPYDRLVAKAIARWGERFSPIGEDPSAFIEPRAIEALPAGPAPGAEAASALESGIRGALTEGS